MLVVVRIMVTFVTPLVTRICQSYEVKHLPNICKKFHGRGTDQVGQYKENVRYITLTLPAAPGNYFD